MDINTLRECVKQLTGQNAKPYDPDKFYAEIYTPYGPVIVSSGNISGSNEAINWAYQEFLKEE